MSAAELEARRMDPLPVGVGLGDFWLAIRGRTLQLLRLPPLGNFRMQHETRLLRFPMLGRLRKRYHGGRRGGRGRGIDLT